MSVKQFISDSLNVKLKRKLYSLKNPEYRWAKEAVVFDSDVKGITEIKMPGYDVFCGYYDVRVFSLDESKILVHLLKDDIAEIAYYDLNEKKFHKITETKAYSWQQGSRLRFSNDDSIFVNRYLDGEYCTSKMDLKGREIERHKVLYDISHDESYGVGLDFNRLQRLRPGYGYKCEEDKTVNDRAPGGLYLVDLKTKKERELISLKELALGADPELKYDHYLNHVSISRDDKYIMFFHLYNTDKGRKSQLCVIDRDGSNLRILESKALVSHYVWLEDDTLLMTGVLEGKDFYRLYDLEGNYTEYIDEILNQDGHPNTFRDVIITDTYPDWLSIQYLIKYDIKERKGKKIASFFADDKLEGEYRCDLHPKTSDNYVAVDSTCHMKRREVVLVRL